MATSRNAFACACVLWCGGGETESRAEQVIGGRGVRSRWDFLCGPPAYARLRQPVWVRPAVMDVVIFHPCYTGFRIDAQRRCFNRVTDSLVRGDWSRVRGVRT